ncbi:MAG TPA: OmpA family protein [Ignavibacteria bacterium]
MKKKFLIVPIWIVSERTIKLRIFKKNQNIMNYNCRKKSQSLKLIFTILLLIISSLAYSQNLDSGLVAYFPFDGNANDISGLNNNGTEYMGGITFQEGLKGKCAKFGGINNPGHIKVANSTSLNVKSTISISLWFRVDNPDGTDGYGNYISTNGGQCLFAKSHDAHGYFAKIGCDGKNKLNIGFANAVSWLNNDIELNNTIEDYKIRTWKHIVFVITKTKAKCYIDGKLNTLKSLDNYSFESANSQDLYFGKYSDKWYPFNGALDEVRIYSRALIDTEIQMLYQLPTISTTLISPANTIIKDAQKAYSDGNYLLVLELLKDFQFDDPLYSEAVMLMNQAIALIPKNINQNFVTVSGSINCGCSKAISGYVVFEDMNTRLSVGKCRITSDGYYCIVLPSGKIYSYYIDSKDFYPVSRVIDFTTTNRSPNYKDNINIVTYEDMKEKQTSVRINNIFFDFNESKLKSESYLELDRLYKFLIENSDISVEISGHTDNVGSDEYNITLSNARANAVKDYLVSKGINANRITSKGYGKSKPVATNDTDEGRQLNRRVEFKIIK